MNEIHLTPNNAKMLPMCRCAVRRCHCRFCIATMKHLQRRLLLLVCFTELWCRITTCIGQTIVVSSVDKDRHGNGHTVGGSTDRKSTDFTSVSALQKATNDGRFLHSLSLEKESLQFQQCVTRRINETSVRGQDDEHGRTETYVVYDICINGEDCTDCATKYTTVGNYLDQLNYNLSEMRRTFCNRCETHCETNNNNNNNDTGENDPGDHHDCDCDGNNGSNSENGSDSVHCDCDESNNCACTPENSNNYNDCYYNYPCNCNCNDNQSCHGPLPWYQGGLNINCHTCPEECQSDLTATVIEDYPTISIIEAIDYSTCMEIRVENNASDSEVLYAGPYCSETGDRVDLGVFADSDCSRRLQMGIEDVLQTGAYMNFDIWNKVFSRERPIACAVADFGLFESCDILEAQGTDCADASNASTTGQEICIASNRTDSPTNPNNPNNPINPNSTEVNGYSMEFQRCVSVDGADGTIDRYAIIELCLEEGCDSCQRLYIDLVQYLQITGSYRWSQVEHSCEICMQSCSQEMRGIDLPFMAGGDHDHHDTGNLSCHFPDPWFNESYVACSFCFDECNRLQNMEENGHYDALEFVDCVMIYDPEDDAPGSVFAAADCAEEGTEITIAAFRDDQCTILQEYPAVGDYLIDEDGSQVALGNEILQRTYREGTSVSCVDIQHTDNVGSAVWLAEVCMEILEAAVGVCGDSSGICSVGDENDHDDHDHGNGNGSGNGTALPDDLPPGFSLEFHECITSISQWGATVRYAVLDLCLEEDCQSCRRQYVDLIRYLEISGSYRTTQAEELCQSCREQCSNVDISPAMADAGNGSFGNLHNAGREYSVDVCHPPDPWFFPDIDCESCLNECYVYENIQGNGYVNALDYIHCEQLYVDEDDPSFELHAGAICTDQGTKIKIGVFADPGCNEFLPEYDVGDFLNNAHGSNVSFSYAILEMTHQEETSMSCKQVSGDDSSVSLSSECIEIQELEGGLCGDGSGICNETENPEDVDDTSSTAFSLEFQNCVSVSNEDEGTVDRFVIVNFCPEMQCDSCEPRHVDLNDYLDIAGSYRWSQLEDWCMACSEACSDELNIFPGTTNEEEDIDEDAEAQCYPPDPLLNRTVDCSECVDECAKLENMEENGYSDALNFVECRLIYDPDDDIVGSRYAGPVCSNEGTKINIGVFADAECMFPLDSYSVGDYLVDSDGYQLRLSHEVIKLLYEEGQSLVCAKKKNTEGTSVAPLADECSELAEILRRCDVSGGICRGNATDDDPPDDAYGYSMQFQQCFVQKNDTGSVLGRYAVIDACLEDNCDACKRQYVGLRQYLQNAAYYALYQMENFCNACATHCDDEHGTSGDVEANYNGGVRTDASVSEGFCHPHYPWPDQDMICSDCMPECDRMSNMEAYGYIDATEFIACQMIFFVDEDETTSTGSLFAAPICSDGGNAISIGVFADEMCQTFLPQYNVEDFLVDLDDFPLRLSHTLLESTYLEGNSMSCLNYDDESDSPSRTLNDQCEMIAAAAEDCGNLTGICLATDDDMPDDLEVGGTSTVQFVTCRRFDDTSDADIFCESCPENGQKRVTSFVSFELCQEFANGTCPSPCHQHVMELHDYATVMVQHREVVQVEACSQCQECTSDEETGIQPVCSSCYGGGCWFDVSCSACAKECQSPESLELKGLFDASQYLQCRRIFSPTQENGQSGVRYAGPVCNNNDDDEDDEIGNFIGIGVFIDSGCTILATDERVENYIRTDGGLPLLPSFSRMQVTVSKSDPYLCPESINGPNPNFDLPLPNTLCNDLVATSVECPVVAATDAIISASRQATDEVMAALCRVSTSPINGTGDINEDEDDVSDNDSDMTEEKEDNHDNNSDEGTKNSETNSTTTTTSATTDDQSGSATSRTGSNYWMILSVCIFWFLIHRYIQK